MKHAYVRRITKDVHVHAGKSCRTIKRTRDRLGLPSLSGKYWMQNLAVNSTAREVHCDMTSDGGGWTLVAYAGTINGNKRSTVGPCGRENRGVVRG